ncbi:MAG: 50S ribosomal protein L11 methyltransferase [Vicinamibacterales bacterium]
MGKSWPALEIRVAALGDADPSTTLRASPSAGLGAGELLAAVLDDFSPAAIEDLAGLPIPHGGLWDPTFPPIPDPPPAPIHWRVFFQNAFDRDAAANAVSSTFPTLALTHIDVEDENWAARSQRSLTAIRAGDFIVAPPWDLPSLVENGVALVVIEPSMGFGTGHHQTTRLCLRLMSSVSFDGRDVIDLGTGSGVLAMAAALRGAHSVRAIDVDADAIESAEASARLNPPLPNLRFQIADFRSAPMVDADVVIANLTGGMLTSAASAIVPLVRAGGQLIVSGFDLHEAESVRAAFSPFDEAARQPEDEWVALWLQRR